jgi:K+-transporting ATPase ATPase A chain
MNGTPMTLKERYITTLEGNEQNVSRGPVAAFVAIKQLGTNGEDFTVQFCNPGKP